jgi:hypothetical protein
MPVLFLYILKLSISLSIVYLFYQLVLRRLTFYNSNRWYLIGYTLLSFLIPFIDITPVLENNSFSQIGIVQLIPAVEKYTSSAQDAATYSLFTTFADWSKWDWISFALLAGAGLFMLQFLIRCISFFNMRRKAELLSVDGVKLYQVNKNIIPFSFGNAVFINSELHTEEEFREIISHEFVHVKQRHTIDIVWSEWLCIINWYNPFAWMLKNSIRQNLEFIADNKVLQNGVDRKQYQYLLLKVIGNNHFSIAPKFNFSSLKKRIAMMNKLKSARLHLVKFLFIVPLMAVILVSFRKQIGDTLSGKQRQVQSLSAIDAKDTIPDVTEPNSKGYLINVKDKKGECLLVIKDKSGKEVKRLLLTEWNANAEKYEAMYGEIPPPPSLYVFRQRNDENHMKDFLKRNQDVKYLDWVFNNRLDWALNNREDPDFVYIYKKDGKTEIYSIANNADLQKVEAKYGTLPYEHTTPAAPPSPEILNVLPPPPAPPELIKLPANVKSINVNNDKATVHFKNGTKENYDLSIPDEKAAFEKKYGALPEPPPPPLPQPAPKPPVGLLETDGINNITVVSGEFEITNKKAVIHLKNGKTEEYDLTNKDSRRKFEKKYGKIINTNINTNVNTNSSININTNVNANSNINTSTAVPSVAMVNHGSGRTVIAPMSPVAAAGDNVIAVDPFGHTITGEEDILVTITKKTTADQLEAFKKQMKEKGIELKFYDIEYENGKLVNISGSMKSKDGHSNFVATDFSKLVLAMIRDGNKTYFKVSVTDNKIVI